MAATSEAQLGAILKLVPVSQLLMGLDNPFIPKSTFVPAIADVTQHSAKRICEASRTRMPSACALNSLSGSGRTQGASYRQFDRNPARRDGTQRRQCLAKWLKAAALLLLEQD